MTKPTESGRIMPMALSWSLQAYGIQQNIFKQWIAPMNAASLYVTNPRNPACFTLGQPRDSSMKPFVQVPSAIEEELSALLLRRYPDLMNNEKSVSYDKGASANTRYTAAVTYHFPKHSSTALFAYVEHKDPKFGSKFSWYCTHDWND